MASMDLKFAAAPTIFEAKAISIAEGGAAESSAEKQQDGVFGS